MKYGLFSCDRLKGQQEGGDIGSVEPAPHSAKANIAIPPKNNGIPQCNCKPVKMADSFKRGQKRGKNGRWGRENNDTTFNWLLKQSNCRSKCVTKIRLFQLAFVTKRSG